MVVEQRFAAGDRELVDVGLTVHLFQRLQCLLVHIAKRGLTLGTLPCVVAIDTPKIARRIRLKSKCLKGEFHSGCLSGRLNITGKVYFTLTGTLCCLPGIHLGMDCINRMASWSSSGSILFTMVILLIEPSFSIII